jgi:hypothetical protein
MWVNFTRRIGIRFSVEPAPARASEVGSSPTADGAEVPSETLV